jgi:PAS domain S-box-containing protein
MSDLHPLGIPLELLAALLDNPHESLILMDAQGIVRYMSKSNEGFYGSSSNDAVGRHILELNPDSEMLRVLKTGRAEIGEVFKLRGKERIIARIPLRDSQGNVRELRNVLERASAVAGQGAISEEHLPMDIRDGIQPAPRVNGATRLLKHELARAERRAIERALSITGDNRTEAARLLGIHRTGLYQKMKRHGLDSGPKS